MWVGCCVPIGYVSGMVCVNWKSAFHSEGKKGVEEQTVSYQMGAIAFQQHGFTNLTEIRNSSEWLVRHTSR